MKTILTLFLCLIFALTAAAQSSYSSKGVRVYDGRHKLSRSATESLFRGSPVYDDYMTGMRYNRVGNCLLWPGVVVTDFGLWYMFLSVITWSMGTDDHHCDPYSCDRKSRSDNYWHSGGAVGLGITLSGVALIAAGATFKVKAKRKVSGAVGMYNDYLFPTENRYVPELSFGLTRGGIGLTYKF